MSMPTVGIILVEHDKLLREIFLPKPSLFQVIRMQSVNDDEGVYTIPVGLYNTYRNECYEWWGGVFERAFEYKIKIEVQLVTEHLCSGFRFHEPESAYHPNYKNKPYDEFYRLRKEALGKNEGIQEIRKNLKILNQVIAGTIPPTAEFKNHLISFVGTIYECMENLCFGENPSVPFPVGDYLCKYGQMKGLTPWDLADAGLLSTVSAECYSREQMQIETAE